MNNFIPSFPYYMEFYMLAGWAICWDCAWRTWKLITAGASRIKEDKTSIVIAMDRSMQHIIAERDKKILQLKNTIAKLEESKVVNVTHIDYVNSFFNTPVASPAQSQVMIEGDHEEVVEATAEEEHENLVFKKFVDGKPLNIEALFCWISQSFLPRLNANYEWFALYRVLRDMNLFESGMNKISKFAEQMNLWFPDAPYPCVAGEVRRYNKGYLGDEPFEKWDRKVFRVRMEDKQSMDGFERLAELCGLLSEELAQELKTGKLKG